MSPADVLMLILTSVIFQVALTINGLLYGSLITLVFSIIIWYMVGQIVLILRDRMEDKLRTFAMGGLADVLMVGIFGADPKELPMEKTFNITKFDKFQVWFFGWTELGMLIQD